eukprot:jgi/Bigna1/87660/estExt_fgenesh1_pg.C_220199
MRVYYVPETKASPDGRVRPFYIEEGGGKAKKFFQSLAELVSARKSDLKQAFMDPETVAYFSISGTPFTVQASLFMGKRDCDTYLGRYFDPSVDSSSGFPRGEFWNHSQVGHSKKDPIFMDRNPAAFNVILNCIIACCCFADNIILFQMVPLRRQALRSRGIAVAIVELSRDHTSDFNSVGLIIGNYCSLLLSVSRFDGKCLFWTVGSLADYVARIFTHAAWGHVAIVVKHSNARIRTLFAVGNWLQRMPRRMKRWMQEEHGFFGSEDLTKLAPILMEHITDQQMHNETKQRVALVNMAIVLRRLVRVNSSSADKDNNVNGKEKGEQKWASSSQEREGGAQENGGEEKQNDDVLPDHVLQHCTRFPCKVKRSKISRILMEREIKFFRLPIECIHERERGMLKISFKAASK